MGLVKFMKKREALELKWVSLIWYTALSVLSGMGAGMMVFDDASLLTRAFEPEDNYKPATRAAVALFCLTKTLEFGDTILLALKKRPVSFLHSFHHFTVALYCWHAQLVNVSFAHLFVLINLCVHATMYGYYALSVVFKGSRGSQGIAGAICACLFTLRPYITSFQLAQMFVGSAISWCAVHGQAGILVNDVEKNNAKWALAMYVSYAVLFGHFYVRSYFKGYRAAMTTLMASFHAFALYGLFMVAWHDARMRLLVEVFVMWQICGFGITVGAHRLWAHRSFEAKLPARVFLMILNSIASQGSILHWARDHRTHHRHSETDKDPHNAKKGFWYAHMGWLLLNKPDEVKHAGREIDCRDLYADPVVMLQKRFDPWWNFSFCFLLPAFYGWAVYGSFWLGFFVHGCLRWIVVLHATWCVNSVAHLWGDRPYDPKSNPAENVWVSVGAVGEGWHNWHHAFPFDYAASELGLSFQWNPSKLLIDFLAAIGQVTHRKRATKHWQSIVKSREARAARLQHQQTESEKDTADEEASSSSPSLTVSEPASEPSKEEIEEAADVDTGFETTTTSQEGGKREGVLGGVRVGGGLKRVPSSGDVPSMVPRPSTFTSLLFLLRDASVCGLIAAFALSLVLFADVPRVLHGPLWALYAVAQGTVCMGLWVIAQECAAGRFTSRFPLVNHMVGLVVSTTLLIPYRYGLKQQLLESEGRWGILPAIREQIVALPRLPLTVFVRVFSRFHQHARLPVITLQETVSLAALSAHVVCLFQFSRAFGVTSLSRWVAGPWIVFQAWLGVYFVLLSVKDEKVHSLASAAEENERERETVASPAASPSPLAVEDDPEEIFRWRWIKASLQIALPSSTPVLPSFFVHFLEFVHHNLLKVHALHSATKTKVKLSVPHYHTSEVAERLKRMSERFHQARAEKFNRLAKGGRGRSDSATGGANLIWRGVKETARLSQYAVDDTPVYN